MERQSKPKQFPVIFGIIAILILLILVSFTTSAPVLRFLGFTHISVAAFLTSRILYWLCLGLLILYSIKIEKQPLLIWGEKKYKIATYLLSVIIIFLVLFAGGLIIQKLLSFVSQAKSVRLSALLNIFRNNNPMLFFTAFTAGVVEELIFRGYLQPRLEIISNSPSLAIILSSLLFGLLHYSYGTLFNVIGPVFIGLVFALYYRKYKNITVLIVCHFLWDAISLLILVKAH
ncbi:MAG: type II CAAX endopeptidase family protein [Ginsengibacter sp.]